MAECVQPVKEIIGVLWSGHQACVGLWSGPAFGFKKYNVMLGRKKTV
jgi:hypothetical protein